MAAKRRASFADDVSPVESGVARSRGMTAGPTITAQTDEDRLSSLARETPEPPEPPLREDSSDDEAEADDDLDAVSPCRAPSRPPRAASAGRGAGSGAGSAPPTRPASAAARPSCPMQLPELLGAGLLALGRRGPVAKTGRPVSAPSGARAAKRPATGGTWRGLRESSEQAMRQSLAAPPEPLPGVQDLSAAAAAAIVPTGGRRRWPSERVGAAAAQSAALAVAAADSIPEHAPHAERSMDSVDADGGAAEPVGGEAVGAARPRDAVVPPPPQVPQYVHLQSSRQPAFSPFDVWLMETGGTPEEALMAFSLAGLDAVDVAIANRACECAACIIQNGWDHLKRTRALARDEALPYSGPGRCTDGWPILCRMWCRRWLYPLHLQARPASVALTFDLPYDARAEDLGVQVGRSLQLVRLAAPFRGGDIAKVPGPFSRARQPQDPRQEDVRLDILRPGERPGRERVLLMDDRQAFRVASAQSGWQRYEVDEELCVAAAASELGEVAQQDWHLVITDLDEGVLPDALRRIGVELSPGCRISRVNRAQLAIDMFRILSSTPLPGDTLEIEVTGGPPELLGACEPLRDWRWPTDPTRARATQRPRPVVGSGAGAFPGQPAFSGQAPPGWERTYLVSPIADVAHMEMLPAVPLQPGLAPPPPPLSPQPAAAPAADALAGQWPVSPVLLTPFRRRGGRSWPKRPVARRPAVPVAQQAGAGAAAGKAPPQPGVFGVFSHKAAVLPHAAHGRRTTHCSHFARSSGTVGVSIVSVASFGEASSSGSVQRIATMPGGARPSVRAGGYAARKAAEYGSHVATQLPDALRGG